MEKKPSSVNPYDILSVSPAASKAEITKAVAIAMKRKEYPLQAIAEAQKSLMDSNKRIIADYLRPILLPIQRFKRQDFSGLALRTPDLTFLTSFETKNTEIHTQVANSIKIINSIDEKWQLPLDTTEVVVSETSERLPSQPELSVNFILSALASNRSFKALPSRKPEFELSPTHLVLDCIRLFFWLLVFGIFLSAFTSNPHSEPQLQPRHTLERLAPFESAQVTPIREIERSPAPSLAVEVAPQRELPRTPQRQPMPNPQVSQRPYSNRFPQNTCGDKDPGGTNNWYPVYVKYSEENLTKIRNFYCRDAIKQQRDTGEVWIQVGSFLTRKDALELATTMQSELGSAEVGQSSLYNFEAPSVRANAAKILRNTGGSFPLSSCGDSNPGGINTWYRVYVDSTEYNFRLIRENYCRDAFVKSVEGTQTRKIQVGSFIDRNDARELASFLRTKMGSGEVGDPINH